MLQATLRFFCIWLKLTIHTKRLKLPAIAFLYKKRKNQYTKNSQKQTTNLYKSSSFTFLLPLPRSTQRGGNYPILNV